MARQYAVVVQESAYGVVPSGEDVVIGTNAFYFEITGDNAVKVNNTPISGYIQSSLTNMRKCRKSDQSQIEGSLTTPLRPNAVTKFLLHCALTPINDDRDEPWVTTDANDYNPVGELPSFALVHAYEGSNGQYVFEGYKGLKVTNLTVNAAAGTQTGATFTLQVQGGGIFTPSSADFPEPDSDDFGCDVFLFSDLEGGLKIGTSRTDFEGVQITVANSLTPTYFEANYPRMIRGTGRTSTVQVSNLYLKSASTDKANYYSSVEFAGEVKYNNSSKTLTFSLPRCTWDSMDDSFTLANPVMRTGTFSAMEDATLGSDISFATTGW